MSNKEQQTKLDGGASVSTAGLGLDAETVQCYLYALLDEAKRRGGMFPQTSDEQDSDSDAIHRICGMVKWYGEQGYPRSGEVVKLHAMRARNMRPNVNVTGAARLHRAASVLTAGLGPKRYEGKTPPTRPKRHQAKLRRTTKPRAWDDARKSGAKPPAMSQARALCLWPRMGDGVGVPWVSRPQAPANN